MTEIIRELAILILAGVATFATARIRQYFKDKGLMEKVNNITDKVVEYIEAHDKGLKGIDKFNLAVDLARTIFEKEKIKVNEQLLEIEIEDGVHKLNMNKKKENDNTDTEKVFFEEASDMY